MKKTIWRVWLAVFALLLLVPLIACGANGEENRENTKQEFSAVAEEKTDVPLVVVDDTLMHSLIGYDGKSVQLLTLSDKYEDRMMQLDAMRVEIMAGGGPDAFILPCDESFLNDGGRNVPLFENPEKVMRSGVFLPLDDLIGQSTAINMDEHYEVIMEAGRTEDGQMVLPLLYKCSAYFVYRDMLQEPDMELNTWDDVLNCTDETVMSFLSSKSIVWFGNQYAAFADYDNEKLLFTPEVLARDMTMLANAASTMESTDIAVIPDEVFDTLASDTWKREKDALTVLTIPNENGGLTAKITAFAAINRNTEHAEQAFRYIELLYKNNMPNSMMIGTVGGITTKRDAYSEEFSELIADLTAKVNAVRFDSDMDLTINQATNIVWENQKDPTAIIQSAEDICDEMNMILAE